MYLYYILAISAILFLIYYLILFICKLIATIELIGRDVYSIPIEISTPETELKIVFEIEIEFDFAA